MVAQLTETTRTATAPETGLTPGAVVVPDLDERLAGLRAGLAGIPLTAYASQTPAEARRTAARLRELRSMLDAHVGAAVRAVERLVPARDARQLLAGDFGLDTAAAHRDVRNARTVAAASLAENSAARGLISHTHAVVIGRAMRDLPEDVTDRQRRRAEQALVDDARRLSPRDLETRARRITDLFDPEPQVDATENTLLARRETTAFQKTSLTLWDNRDGTWTGRFVLPELQARILKTVIDAYAAPRRTHLREAAADGQAPERAVREGGVHGGDSSGTRDGRDGCEAGGNGTCEGGGACDGGARDGGGGYGIPRVQQARIDVEDDKPYDRKAGEALLALIEHLPVDGLPTTGGTPARVMVTIGEAKLRSAVAAGTLTTGERLSAGEVRRLACQHGILPMVLGGTSVPVDLGRTQRLFNSHQRDALAALDGGCVAPGCDRPSAWCETHHGADPWKAGGNTDLKDGYLLCNSHHHEAHRKRWTFRRRSDGRAEIERGHGWEHNHRYRP